MLLAALVLALVVPLGGLSAYLWTAGYRSDRRRAETQLLGVAHQAATGIQQFLADTRRLMDGMASDPDLISLDPERCGFFFTRQAHTLFSPTYANLATWRGDGTPVCTFHRGPTGTTSSIPGLEAALASETFTVTPVQRGVRSDRWITAVTRPLRDENGRKVGILSLPIDLLRFQEILNQLPLPEGAIVSVTELEGTVVARSKDPERWVGSHPARPLPSSGDDESRGLTVAETLEGGRYRWGSVAVEGAPWVVYAGLPAQDVFGDVWASGLRLLLLGFLVTAGAFTAGWLVYRRIAMPLDALVGGIAAANVDGPSEIPTDGPQEIAWVAERFNHAWAARHQALEQRERADDRIRSLVENAVNGMCVATEGGRFLQVNQSMADILGYATPEELLTVPLDRIYNSPEERRAHLERLGDLPEFRGVPVEYRRKDGSRVDARISGRRLRLEGGEVAWEVIVEDVTELTRLQNQALQTQKMEALGRLAGSIAHDFNNILTVVQGQADLLRTDPDLDDDLRDQVDEIFHSAERGAALNRQLLAFGRRSPGGRTSLDLNQVVRDFHLVLRRAVGEDVALELDLEEDLSPIRGDRSKLEQILMNLAVNARDSMAGTGTLTIGTRGADPEASPPGLAAPDSAAYAVLSVADTGSGISDEVLPHIFEPFFSTKPETKGTGLGLATVYGIVTDAGGHIEVDSTPGQGTTFTIHLPLHRDADASPPREDAAAATDLAGPTSGVILLAEDEVGVRRLATAILTKAGYTVLAAADAAEALALADGHPGPIDLLLTDIVMPGMRGHELASALASRGRVRRAVFFSGYPEGFTAEGLEGDVAWDYIAKPFTGSQLLGTVARLLGGSA